MDTHVGSEEINRHIITDFQRKELQQANIASTNSIALYINNN